MCWCRTGANSSPWDQVRSISRQGIANAYSAAREKRELSNHSCHWGKKEHWSLQSTTALPPVTLPTPPGGEAHSMRAHTLGQQSQVTGSEDTSFFLSSLIIDMMSSNQEHVRWPLLSKLIHSQKQLFVPDPALPYYFLPSLFSPPLTLLLTHGSSSLDVTLQLSFCRRWFPAAGSHSSPSTSPRQITSCPSPAFSTKRMSYNLWVICLIKC